MNSEIYSIDELVMARTKEEYTKEIKDRLLAGDIVQLQDGRDICINSCIDDIDQCERRKAMANLEYTPSLSKFIELRNDKVEQFAAMAANTVKLEF